MLEQRAWCPLIGRLIRRATPHAGASDHMEHRMQTGTVKWFNLGKGYGFIQPQDGSGDVFVHASEVERAGLGTLAEGQTIGFEVEAGRQGKLSAIQLQRA
jgi:CspA family cold shock protein